MVSAAYLAKGGAWGKWGMEMAPLPTHWLRVRRRRRGGGKAVSPVILTGWQGRWGRGERSTLHGAATRLSALTTRRLSSSYPSLLRIKRSCDG